MSVRRKIIQSKNNPYQQLQILNNSNFVIVRKNQSPKKGNTQPISSERNKKQLNLSSKTPKQKRFQYLLSPFQRKKYTNLFSTINTSTNNPNNTDYVKNSKKLPMHFFNYHDNDDYFNETTHIKQVNNFQSQQMHRQNQSNDKNRTIYIKEIQSKKKQADRIKGLSKVLNISEYHRTQNSLSEQRRKIKLQASRRCNCQHKSSEMSRKQVQTRCMIHEQQQVPEFSTQRNLQNLRALTTSYRNKNIKNKKVMQPTISNNAKINKQYQSLSNNLMESSDWKIQSWNTNKYPNNMKLLEESLSKEQL